MIASEARLVYRQRAAIERLGLSEAFRLSKQFRQIAEVSRHYRMVRPVARLIDLERAAK
jgi:hypothetical protein